jgi:mono/diheme cytochrome c family protein
MLRRRMTRRRTVPMVLAALVAAFTLAACGTEKAEVPDKAGTAEHAGDQLFYSHCSGCHTLDVAGAQGSATKVRDRERVDGPNFNQRKETYDQVLYAIRNGGFSGAIMPENIVTGPQAKAIARFLAKYSGKDAKSPPAPTPISSSGG